MATGEDDGAREAAGRAPRLVDLREQRLLHPLADQQRLADRLSGHHAAASPNASMRTFRLDDMVRPPINWTLLDEVAGTEMVLGQIGRPWQPTQMG